MSTASDPVRDRMESAERMLRQARDEHARQRDDDAVEFLAAAQRHVARAMAAITGMATVVELPRKEVPHGR